MEDEFISLPVLYESWPQLRESLKSLANSESRSVEALEELLAKNNKWGNVHLPLSLLRNLLDKEEQPFCTTRHFCDVLLPWMANSALKVEHLFKDAQYKIKVGRIYF